MHNASMRSLGFDGIYLALDVHPDRLMEVLPAMSQMGFGGVNLTVPHKEIAFQGLSQLDESALLLGAANTVAFTPDGLVGYNTDGYGFLTALQSSFGKKVAGDEIFVLGCGGAGRATALLSAREGASRLVLADIDQARMEKLADEINTLSPSVKVECVQERDIQVEACRSCDLVVQASPVGMKREDQSLLPSDAFHAHQRVFDLIYMYPETAFLAKAREAGAAIANGLDMLLHQGARAFTIWTGEEPNTEVMRNVLEEAVYGIDS
jgi:shikimate dehydrogenase